MRTRAGMSWRLFWVAIVVLAAGLAGCSSGDDGGGGDDGRVAWSSPAGNNAEIYVADLSVDFSAHVGAVTPVTVLQSGRQGTSVVEMRVDGRTVRADSAVFRAGLLGRAGQAISFSAINVRQVTHNSYGDWAPEINPSNWNEIFYHTIRGGGMEIYKTDVGTGVETRMALGSDPNLDEPGKLYYSSGGIWRLDLGNGQATRILAGTAYDPLPMKRGSDKLIFFNSPTAWTGESFSGKANFVLNENTGTVYKLTRYSMKEDNPVPNSGASMVVWHAWPPGESHAAIHYGKLQGFRVESPVRLTFRDDVTGETLVGDHWYTSWIDDNHIQFTVDDRIYVADLQGNAHDTGLRGEEPALAN